MARDESNGSGQDGGWDFDLPDLGASTTPGHHRGSRRGPARQQPDAQGQRNSQDSDRPARNDRRGEPRETRDGDPGGRPGKAPFDSEADSGPGPSRGGGREYDDEAYDDGNGAGGAGNAGPGAGVYRRRRLIALIVAVLLVGVVGFGIMNMVGGGEAEPDPAVTAQPTSTDPFDGFSARPESEASDGASGPAARACGEQLTVTASTDQPTYSEDTDPVLIMTLENGGDEACMVNAGTARMNFTVMSGQEKVFDSEHCQIDGQDRPIELNPGETESARFEWNRHDSVADCATEGTEVQPGTYRLTVALGEIRSEGQEFTLE